jgi:ABC-type transport system involved in cytochrome bd biosynthesis fused ATPase/permease subunit
LLLLLARCRTGCRFRSSVSAEAGADDAEDADDADDLHPSRADNGSAGRQQGRQQPWQTSLSMLSGGQRTLVSLAMLLAVSRAGNSSGLFLLDEVDAALDEHNTARAAALLKQLAHADDGGRGCQILCVTHNAAFQHVCDGFVQVDAAGRSTGGDAAPAAAGAGRAAAAKKGRAGAVAGGSNSSKPAAKKVRFAG